MKTTRWTVEWFDVPTDCMLYDTFDSYRAARGFWTLLRRREDATNLDLYRGEPRRL